MKKKITLTMIILSLMIIPVNAQDNQIKTTEYTLDQMIELYMSQSEDIDKLKIEYELNKNKYEDVVESYDDFTEKVETMEGKVKIYDTYKQQAFDEHLEAEVDSLERNTELAMYNIFSDVYTQYEEGYKEVVKGQAQMLKTAEILKLQLEQSSERQKKEEKQNRNDFYLSSLQYNLSKENLKLKEQELELVKMKLDIENKKFELDMTTATSVKELENEYNVAQDELINIKNNVELEKEQLKTKMNIPVEEDIELIITMEEPKYELNIEYEIFERLYNQKSLNVAVQRKNVEVEKMYLEKIKVAYDEDELEIKKAEAEYKKVLLEDRQTQSNIGLMLKQVYSSYNNELKSYQLSIKTKDLAEKQFKIAEQKYNQGTISKLEYEQEKYNYNEKLYDYQNALYKYIQAQISFEQTIEGM